MKNIIVLFILLIAIPYNRLYSQIAVAYYPFQSELSISSNTDNILWGDLRLATNTFWGNITTEPALMVNIKEQKWVNYYAGVGANFNFFNSFDNVSVLNGYALYLGTRIKPLQNLKNIQCIFEISPYMNPQFDGGLLRTRLGIAYQFISKK